MAKLDSPLQISPVFKPKIWGRFDLAPIFPKTEAVKRGGSRLRPSTHRTPSGALIGEVWVTDNDSKLLNGPKSGATLAEAVKTYGPDLCGSRWSEPRFPILAKYIFTSDWLSVQVHPDDEYARAYEPDSPGKFEMWYVVERDKGGGILLGLKRGASAESLRSACLEGKGKGLLYAFHPHVSEAIFVPPGTVHALGPGLTLFEVEQNSDLTYRLDDFGRAGLDGKPRPLHWDKAMEVIQVDRKPLRNLPRLEIREPYGSCRAVVACRHFAVEELTVTRQASFTGAPERVETFSILAGDGRIESEAGWMTCKQGETWLIPPATPRYRLVPQESLRLLKFYVPDLDRDFRRPLKRRGVSAVDIASVVFD